MIGRIAVRNYASQFNKELSSARNWRLDLNRAVVLEKMNLSTFYSTTVSKTRKFESLASIEKEQLTRKRAEAETKEAMRIFEVSNMKNPKDGLEKASDILEAVQEMEGLYQGFNRTAVKFFRLTGKLEEKLEKRNKIFVKKPGNADATARYNKAYDAYVAKYGNKHWIPSFLSPEADKIDAVTVAADLMEWNAIKEKVLGDIILEEAQEKEVQAAKKELIAAEREKLSFKKCSIISGYNLFGEQLRAKSKGSLTTRDIGGRWKKLQPAQVEIINKAAADEIARFTAQQKPLIARCITAKNWKALTLNEVKINGKPEDVAGYEMFWEEWIEAKLAEM